MKSLLAVASVFALLFSSACTQSPEKLLASANKYHANKKYKEASILYRKVIAKDKTNAEAYYREGLNLLDEGNPAEAARFLRRAVDLKPANSDAEIKLAEIYLAFYSRDPNKLKNLLSEARDLTSKILQQDPNSFDGIRLQGLVDLADNQNDKALAQLEKANRIKPYSRDVVGWYAQTLLKENQAEKAEALVNDMLAHDKTWGPGYDFLFLYYSRTKNPDKALAVLQKRAENDPTNEVAIVNLANYLLANNHYDQAEAVMKRVLVDKSKFPNGRQLMGDFYSRAKKPDLALQQYRAGIQEDPKNETHYQERIVAMDLMAGHLDDALKLAKELATKNPKNASANEMYASLLSNPAIKTDKAQSLDELKKLVENNPDDAILQVQLARAYLVSNDTDKALSQAQAAIQQESKQQSPRPAVLVPARMIVARILEDRGDHAKALEQTDSILAAAPKNPQGQLIRDRALIGLNEVDRAQPELEALVAQYPKMNDAHLALGNIYLSQKNYAKASEQFEQIWKANPPDPRGFLGLQSVKLAEGKGGEAIQAMQDLVQKNPNVLAYRYQLANFQALAGSQVMNNDSAKGKALLQQAADNYKQILKTTNNSGEVWLKLGMMQRQLGQLDAALASFEQAEHANSHLAAAPLNRGMLLETMGKEKEAIEAYKTVLALDPRNAVALNNLAFLNAETGSNLDQAMTYAEKAKQQAPDSPAVSDTLGYVYYQKNLNSEAIRIFRQLVQDNPSNATFRLHLAMALLKEGDKQGARDEAGKALKIANPGEQGKIRSFVNQIG